MVINRDSKAYRFGKFLGRATLVVVGFFLGKRLGRKPITDFPKKD